MEKKLGELSGSQNFKIFLSTEPRKHLEVSPGSALGAKRVRQNAGAKSCLLMCKGHLPVVDGDDDGGRGGSGAIFSRFSGSMLVPEMEKFP